jgi:hypothetical protein
VLAVHEHAARRRAVQLPPERGTKADPNTAQGQTAVVAHPTKTADNFSVPQNVKKKLY